MEVYGDVMPIQIVNYTFNKEGPVLSIYYIVKSVTKWAFSQLLMGIGLSIRELNAYTKVFLVSL